MRLDDILHGVHGSFGVFGTLSNSLLIFLILRKTPKSFATYAVILLNCAVVDFVANVCDLLLLHRYMPATPMLAYTFYGLCVYTSPFTCFVFHCIQIHTFIHSSVLLVVSFWYRCMAVRASVSAPSSPSSLPSVATLYCILVISYLPSFALMVIFTFTPLDNSSVRQLYQTRFPSLPYDWEADWGLFVGHQSMAEPILLFAVLYCSTMVTMANVFVLVYRAKALRSLAAHASKMSKRTHETHRMLIRALTIHAILPAFNVAGLSIFLLQCLDVFHSPAVETAIITCLAVPPSLNPIFTIYFVAPYKRAVASILFGERRKSVVHSTPSLSNATQTITK